MDNNNGNGAAAPEGVPLPPVRLEVGYVGRGKDAKVVLTEYGPLSTHTTHLDPDQADKIAETIKAAATKARLGLTLPGPGGVLS